MSFSFFGVFTKICLLFFQIMIYFFVTYHQKYEATLEYIFSPLNYKIIYVTILVKFHNKLRHFLHKGSL